MAQNEFENNNYFNQINDPIDNIFFEQPLNTAEINNSILDNKNKTNSPSPNFQKTKSNFQFGNINEYADKSSSKFQKSSNSNQKNYNYKNNNKRNDPKKSFYNKSIGNTTPNRSFLTKSKLSINSKNSSYKNIKRKNNTSIYTNYNNKSNISNLNKNLRNYSPNITYNNNFMKKDQNKESIIINKLTQEVEHIKNYCKELQRQFDNHCMIKNEKKEFDNIKKENIKLSAEVSILKDDVAELMKKFNLINNKIDSMQQENNNLKMQNKNLLNFISIMSNNSQNGIKRLKSFNMNQFSNNSLLNINNNNNINYNQDLFSNNSNNESMNIINLINNTKSNNNIKNDGRKSFVELNKNNNNKLSKNSSLKSLTNNNNFMNNTNYDFNKNNNINSELIDFSISNSISKNFDKIQEKPKDNNFKTINNFDSKNDYTNINTNTNTNNNTNINFQSKINQAYQTIQPIGNVNKNMNNNATDIVSLIQSNFNLTNQFRNNSSNKQNRYLIPKRED